MTQLCTQKCVPCEGGTQPMTAEEIQQTLSKLDDWQYDAEQQLICKSFEFKGFGKTMAFVNAVAWIATQEMHHPDMQVSYNKCVVHFTTHAINGLSENDFICAAKVDALLK